MNDLNVKRLDRVPRRVSEYLRDMPDGPELLLRYQECIERLEELTQERERTEADGMVTIDYTTAEARDFLECCEFLIDIDPDKTQVWRKLAVEFRKQFGETFD